MIFKCHQCLKELTTLYQVKAEACSPTCKMFLQIRKKAVKKNDCLLYQPVSVLTVDGVALSVKTLLKDSYFPELANNKDKFVHMKCGNIKCCIKEHFEIRSKSYVGNLKKHGEMPKKIQPINAILAIVRTTEEKIQELSNTIDALVKYIGDLDDKTKKVT